MASMLSWFRTTQGKNFAYKLSLGAATATFLVHYLPETIFIDKYQSIVSLYKNCDPLPVPDSVMNLFKKTITDLNLNRPQYEYLTPFMVFGFDVFHAGFISGRYGARIGIPINFTYTDPDTINPTDILINNEPVDWSKPEAKKLLESLVLSKDAQCYGIAKEILMSNHSKPLINGLIGTIIISSYHVLTSSINTRFKMFEQPLLIRGLMYFVVGSFCTGIYFLQKDMFWVLFEEQADAEIASKGEAYVKGAIEYHTKMLERNKALRKLLGKKGEEVYDAEGHEIHLLRKPTVPINKKIQYFHDVLSSATDIQALSAS